MLKRLFAVLFTSAMTATYAFGQKIVINHTAADGFRSIGTDYQIARDFKDKQVFSYGIAAFTDGTHITRCLEVKIGCFEGADVKKGGKVLIKTFKGEVFSSSVGHDATAQGEVMNISGFVTTVWNLPVSIELSLEQLQKLATDGIQKIRIEGGGAVNYEKEYKKDKTSEGIAARLALVEKELATKKDFSDGF